MKKIIGLVTVLISLSSQAFTLNAGVELKGRTVRNGKCNVRVIESKPLTVEYTSKNGEVTTFEYPTFTGQHYISKRVSTTDKTWTESTLWFDRDGKVDVLKFENRKKVDYKSCYYCDAHDSITYRELCHL